jgi:monofunctional biosynthetic peptidoglycan transglycosylase
VTRWPRRLLLSGSVASLVWLVGVWPPPSWWRTHWPRETAMMRRRADRPVGRPVPLAEFAPVLQRMVILAEDSRVRSHRGIDPAELRDALGLRPGAPLGEVAQAAWRRRDRLRGASTLTQQLAKNLYLSPARNPLRKLKELVTAFRLEGALPKDRILELYLNVAEWGIGVWGADAASRAYFGLPASRLTADQAAALAATLPHPRTSNPLFRPARMEWRKRLILARYYGADVTIPTVDELDIDSIVIPPVEIPILPPLPDSLLIPATDTSPASTSGEP